MSKDYAADAAQWDAAADGIQALIDDGSIKDPKPALKRIDQCRRRAASIRTMAGHE